MKHFLCLTDTNKQMINGRILQDEIKFRCAKTPDEIRDFVALGETKARKRRK